MQKIQQISKNIRSGWAKTVKEVNQKTAPTRKKTLSFIDKNPFKSFIALLLILIALIIIGNTIRQAPKDETQTKKEPKHVQVYSIGKAPRINIQAKVEKSGVSKVVALTGGVVSSISKSPGDHVAKGGSLFYISSNYQGANLAGVSRELAQKNLAFIKDSYDTQKSLISTNKEIANKVESQAQELLDIQGEATGSTQSLINLNQDILNSIRSQIAQLESMNINGSSDSAILQLQMAQAQVQSGLAQAQTQLNTIEYQSNDDNEPSQLARLQKDATIRSLDIQEKTLDLNRDIAKLNLRIAQIQESFSYPASPFTGVVERINVQVGDYVNPGTVLATVSSDKQNITLIVFTSANIAQNVSRVEPTTIYLNGKSIEVYPSYVSTEATAGNLYTISFILAEEFAKMLKDNESVEVSLPIGIASTNGYFPFIPLDSIFQTKNKSFMFITKKEGNKKVVKSQQIELGQIYGNFVEVTKGFSNGMEVILDRNVIAGDTVETEIQ